MKNKDEDEDGWIEINLEEGDDWIIKRSNKNWLWKVLRVLWKVFVFTCKALWKGFVFLAEEFYKLIDWLANRQVSERVPSWSVNSFDFSRGINDAVSSRGYDVRYDGANDVRNIVGGFLKQEPIISQYAGNMVGGFLRREEVMVMPVRRPVRQSWVRGHYRVTPSVPVQRAIQVMPSVARHPVYGYKYPGKDRYSI